MDKYDKATRSRMMRAVKSKRTILEDNFSRELWKRGFRFRRNVKDLYGKPDIAIKKYQIVVLFLAWLRRTLPDARIQQGILGKKDSPKHSQERRVNGYKT
jgi:DNA mismatch endonuclease Vsr